MKLKDKIAVVTGAGAGIGKAISEMFAAEGARVVVAARRALNGQPVADGIVKKGGQAIFVEADSAVTKDVKRMVDHTLTEYGQIDILVNNAAIIRKAKVVDTTDELWNKIINNNLTSCFLNSREVAKVMIKQNKGGKIVNISSIHAVLSYPYACAYSTAKGGMEAFSRTLATELAPYKINVNCLAPGATYTELTRPQYTEPVKKALYERISLKEIAEPEWIATGALFLASDDSRYMTGQVLIMDGGYIMDGSIPGATYGDVQD